MVLVAAGIVAYLVMKTGQWIDDYRYAQKQEKYQSDDDYTQHKFDEMWHELEENGKVEDE